jgi:Xaa-Pro aminopeptidase
VEQATLQAPEFRVVEHGLKIADTLREIVTDAGINKLGFERDVVTYKQHDMFSSALDGVELVPTEGIVEMIRTVKDEHEIDAIRKAEALGDAAFSHVLDIIKPGMTEIEVALEIEWFMRKNGAEGIGFDVIVASGERGAMPHGVASSKKLAKGELVVMDFGAIYHGYRGDMTRTVSLGKASPKQREIYDIVLRAQETALQGIRPGRTGQEIDALARKVIEDAGYGENFGHGLGHGVGLAIHEEPRLSVTATEKLLPGMVVTVEPGIYVPGFAGVRIEDLVVVEEDGIRNLTSSSKELIEL